jgi:hypothetical protein
MVSDRLPPRKRVASNFVEELAFRLANALANPNPSGINNTTLATISTPDVLLSLRKDDSNGLNLKGYRVETPITPKLKRIILGAHWEAVCWTGVEKRELDERSRMDNLQKTTCDHSDARKAKTTPTLRLY